MKVILIIVILVGLVLGPAYWVYGKFYSGRSVQKIALVRSGDGRFTSGEFKITPDMAPAGIILTATGGFAPNMPDDQPPQVGFEARLSKNGTSFNAARFLLKAGSTGNTNPSFKENLFFLEAPQNGTFMMELEAKTPQTIRLDSVRIELKANMLEPDGRIVSAAVVLLSIALLILVI
jgi:hypothetical protein